jgi:hypothetical protein
MPLASDGCDYFMLREDFEYKRLPYIFINVLSMRISGDIERQTGCFWCMS